MRRNRFIDKSKKNQTVINIWKKSLANLLNLYDTKRGKLKKFLPKLFIFFIILNITCYWWAMVTAFPEDIVGREKLHYFLLQFPVGILGAIFDTLSFFITIFIARKALKTHSTVNYIAHLSIDFIIAFVATWWVLFVFSFSGWLIGLILQNPESLAQRNGVYEQMLTNAVQDPTKKDNLKNIYFGVIMGISAMLPTITHISLSIVSIFKYFKRRFLQI